MRILTIGTSPYLNMAKSKIHALILEDIYFSSDDVACMAWMHDATYFIPEEHNGRKLFFYNFERDGKNHKLPILPFDRGKQESVSVYEVMNALCPDILITVGDLNDFVYMQAVRMFYTQPFKWICVLTGTSDPINEKNKELLNNADAILCLSEKSKNDVSKYFEKDTLYMSYVGYNQNYFKPDEKDLETIRITAFAKNSQNDNLATIMEVAKDLHDDGFDFELYLHTNLHDQFGDYDLNVLKGRFDPHDKFIKLPERFVSLVDGYPSAELAEILNNSDIFISIPMVSGSGMSIFEALRCGCWPVLSDCGISPEITELLVNFSSNFQRNDFLIPCIKTMTRGECYLSMVCPDKLKESLKNLLQNKKNIKGSRKAFSECVKRLDNSRFLADVRRIIQEVQKSKEVLCLETL